MRKRISEEEVNRLYEEFKTPPNVIRHCQAVTRTAMGIATALNEHGFSLDLDLVKGSCLVHDCARTKARHWDVAADRLVGLGFFEESIIVRNHMTGTGYHDISEINEQDLIWLGDRLVKEDQYVGIDERFDYIMEKARSMGVSEEHFRHIEESKQDMKRLMDQIADTIGQSIDSLFV